MSQQKLDSDVFRATMTPELKYLFDLFTKNSYELKIAGGAVRDLLMGIKPHDIDFATTATPDQMKELFTRENIRMINNNGEKHGTITVRLEDKENYEITTLRIDVTTDGRRAEVQFTNDWRLDANRRDLTINSIFLEADGTIVDFFNGYNDLLNRRVKFVGEPAVRIKEDYLRILRYFRFYSRVCLDKHSHDEPSIEAIRENADGLNGIAGERIWVEFRKIVVSKFANSIVRLMAETNVLKNIGFPETCNLEDFDQVFRLYETDLTRLPLPITMVCLLLNSKEEFETLHKRVKYSNEEKKVAEFFFDYRNMKATLEAYSTEEKLKFFKFIIIDNSKDARIYEKIGEVLKYINATELIVTLTDWPVPVFPINGKLLGTKKVPKGPVYTSILSDLKKVWKNHFDMDTSQATVDQLLRKCDDLVLEYNTI